MITLLKNTPWKKLMPAILLIGAFIVMGMLSSCSKDEELTKTDLLVGTWKLEEIDGDRVRSTLIIEVTFERNGDFEQTLRDDGVFSRITGGWEWNRREDEILIEYDEDFADLELVVEILNAEELEVDDGVDVLLFIKE